MGGGCQIIRVTLSINSIMNDSSDLRKQRIQHIMDNWTVGHYYIGAAQVVSVQFSVFSNAGELEHVIN